MPPFYEIKKPPKHKRATYFSAASTLFFSTKFQYINTLRTGDADLRFYITTVQNG